MNPDQLKTENDKLQSEVTDLKAQVKAYEQEKKESRGQNVRITKRLVKWWAGGELTSSFYKLYDELPKVSKQTFAEFSASIVRRFTRLGFFAVLFAVLPVSILIIQTFIFKNQTTILKEQTTVLKEQTKKIDIQNALFENQNKKIDTQIALEEASRRNNLVLLMDNILEKVNTELENSEDMKIRAL